MRGGMGGLGSIGGRSSIILSLYDCSADGPGAWPAHQRYAHLSHARWQHAYDRATSSSAFSVLARRRDCARSEPASSTRAGGRFEFWVGRSDNRAGSICRLIFAQGQPVVRCEVSGLGLRLWVVRV
jgi:hypothetical protein